MVGRAVEGLQCEASPAQALGDTTQSEINSPTRPEPGRRRRVARGVENEAARTIGRAEQGVATPSRAGKAHAQEQAQRRYKIATPAATDAVVCPSARPES